jgi:hypothetical protein
MEYYNLLCSKIRKIKWGMWGEAPRPVSGNRVAGYFDKFLIKVIFRISF